MNNGQLDISTIIMVGIIAFIGLILLVVGITKNKRILRMWGIIFLMGAGVGLFVMSAELRGIITAFTAVVAVIIAAYSINESRRIRKDSIERENRDRKERLLNEITEWLRELHRCIYTGFDKIGSAARDATTADSKAQVETLFNLYRFDSDIANVEALVSSISEAQYYQRLASKLDEGLGISIQVIVNDLEGRLQLVRERMKLPSDSDKEKGTSEFLDKEMSELMDKLIEDAGSPLEGLNLSDRAIHTVHLGRSARAIRKATLDAVDRAIELKTSLIEVG